MDPSLFHTLIIALVPPAVSIAASPPVGAKTIALWNTLLSSSSMKR